MSVTVAAIKQSVSERYGISVLDIESVRRTRSVVRPRQIAMYLARKMTTQSLPEIGRRFNNRDHTIVLHACRRVAEAIKVEPGLAELLDQLAEQVTGKTTEETVPKIEQLAELMAPIIAEKVRDSIITKQEKPKAEPMGKPQAQQFHPPAIIKLPEPKSQPDMDGSIIAVVNAITKWETEKFSRGERFALEQLEKACLELRRQFRRQPPKLIERKSS